MNNYSKNYCVTIIVAGLCYMVHEICDVYKTAANNGINKMDLCFDAKTKIDVPLNLCNNEL